MKFYNREEELSILEKISTRCKEGYGKSTVLTGRHRVGKTQLTRKHAEGKESLYLFTSEKAEKLLCQEYVEEYSSFTGKAPLGTVERFVKLFEMLHIYGKDRPYVLILDEF